MHDIIDAAHRHFQTLLIPNIAEKVAHACITVVTVVLCISNCLSSSRE